MTALARQRPLVAGLVAGIVVAWLAHWLLEPSNWLRPGLGRVLVIGTCSYSKVAVDILRDQPDAPFVPLVVPAESPEFEADVCDLARARLRRAGAWWLAVMPRGYVCKRLQDLAVHSFVQQTSGEGYPAWIGAAGDFVGLGVDPRQIAALGLAPTPPIVRFWLEGGYDRDLVESLGFAVPDDAVQGPKIASPSAGPSVSPPAGPPPMASPAS